MHRNNAGNFVVVKICSIIHFKNDSSVPALLYKDNNYPWLGWQTLAASRADSLNSIYLYKSGILLSLDPQGWRNTHDKLNQNTPPSDFIRVIEPNGVWTINKDITLSIEVDGSFDGSTKPWKIIRNVDPLWLQLHVQLWPDNLDEIDANKGFGMLLQKRWKNNGHLILQDVSSEPVPIHLPATDG